VLEQLFVYRPNHVNIDKLKAIFEKMVVNNGEFGTFLLWIVVE
jgi:hypothetical protein